MAKRSKKKKLKKRIKSKSKHIVLHKKIFEVAVVATMSSGKSTLVNALIGSELLPSKNQACTSRLFKIENHDNLDGFKATVINDTAMLPSKWIDASYENLAQLNDIEDESTILIHGNIESIHNQDLNFVIYDTPGPNNSQDRSHAKKTQSLLNNENFDLVLYVLNATQIGVDDDAKLLRDLSDNISHKKNLIFVLNKSDQLDAELDEGLNDVVENVGSYLERLGFNAPVIVPISSIAALLARKVKANQPLTTKEKRTYHSFIEHLGDIEHPLYHYSNISESLKKRLTSDNTICIREEDRLIQYSGITAIEYLLNEKLKVSNS